MILIQLNENREHDRNDTFSGDLLSPIFLTLDWLSVYN